MNGLEHWVTATALVTLIIAVWKSSSDNHIRVGRVYQRLDEVKEQHQEKYTSKEVCGILHQELKEDMREIKTDVKKILQKNSIS